MGSSGIASKSAGTSSISPRQPVGCTASPRTRSSRCRCGAFDTPVLPTFPITSPLNPWPNAHERLRPMKIQSKQAGPASLHGSVDGVTDEVGRAALRAELDGRVAHLYGPTGAEFTYILGTFPLVAQEVKHAALSADRRLGDPARAQALLTALRGQPQCGKAGTPGGFVAHAGSSVSCLEPCESCQSGVCRWVYRNRIKNRRFPQFVGQSVRHHSDNKMKKPRRCRGLRWWAV